MNILKGDFIKVVDNSKIELGYDLTNGKEYEVKSVFPDRSIIVRDDVNDVMLITIEEMKKSIVKVEKSEPSFISDLIKSMRELIEKAEQEMGRKHDEKTERKHDEKPEIKIDLKNLARKKVIADAEKFIEKHTKPNCHVRGKAAITYDIVYGVDTEFHVNKEKRVITLLLRGAGDGEIMHTEIVRCSPTDIFNETIGKAIAVGRAFNKDITAFINAPQPSEVAVGQVFKATSHGAVHGQTGKVTEMVPDLDGIFGTAFYHSIDGGWLGANQVQIIDDTEATYE